LLEQVIIKNVIYTKNNDFEARPTRFVQTALFEMLKHEGEHIDKVYVFITEEAKDRNYYDCKMKDGTIRRGLKNIWTEMFPEHKDKLIPVNISSDQSEEGHWKLFEDIYEVIEKNDEIYFDITHSFRSMPLIALLVTNFARIIDRAKINRLLYGNFEVLLEVSNSLGKKLEDIDIQKKKAPIVDITSMLNLFDWSTGVESFLETGNPKQILQLTEDRLRGGSTKDLLPIVNLARSLNHLNESMETSRGVKIQQDIKHVKENLQKVKQVPEHLMPQFSKLINKIEEKVDGFTNDRRVNMWATIKWCAISGLHQQAYTFAFEYIISVMYAELMKQKVIEKQESNRNIRNDRDQISYIMQTILNPKQDFTTHYKKDNEKLINEIDSIMNEELEAFRHFQTITKYRHNMNHAEKAQEELPVTKIHANIIEIVDGIKPIFFKKNWQ